MPADNKNRLFAYFRTVPAQILFAAIVFFPFSVVFAELTCRAIATGQANLALNRICSAGLFSAETIKQKRNLEHLAFIALFDKNRRLIYSEPKTLWLEIMPGESNQFVEKYGWTIYRLNKTDSAGNIISLGAYAGSQISTLPDQSIVEHRISIESVILILFFEYFCLALFIELTFSSTLRDIDGNLANVARGAKRYGFLDDQFVIPWYWSEDLRQLRVSVINALANREQQPGELDHQTTSDQVKWRSATLELQKIVENLEQEPAAAISSVFASGFPTLDALREELILLMAKRMDNSLCAALIAEKEEYGPWQGHWKANFATGFQRQQMRMLAGLELDEIAEQMAHSGRSRVLGALNVAQYKLDSVVALLGARSVSCIALNQNSRLLGVLLLFSRNDPSQLELAPIDRAWQSYRNSYYEHYLAKISQTADLLDKPTGLYNRKFVQTILKGSDAAIIEPIVMTMVFNHSDTIPGAPAALPNDSVTAALLLEFVKSFSAQAEMQASLQCAIQDENQFVLLCWHGQDDDLRLLISSLGKFLFEAFNKIGFKSAGIVFGICNQAVDNKVEALRRATLAAEFGKVQNEFKSLSLIESAAIPKDFNDWGKSSVLRGKLGVFDAGEILQSLGSSQRTGRFTVDDRQGRTFYITFDSGKPVVALLKQDNQVVFSGSDAICEYITTFSAGDFEFNESAAVEQTLSNMPPLFNCLMTAALASDHLEQARQVIFARQVVVATLSNEARHNLLQSGELNPLEQETIQAIEKICQRPVAVGDILKCLDGVPTHRRWHSLALMKTFGLLKVLDEPEKKETGAH